MRDLDTIFDEYVKAASAFHSVLQPGAAKPEIDSALAAVNRLQREIDYTVNELKHEALKMTHWHKQLNPARKSGCSCGGN